MKQPNLYLMCGVPGAGKSTWLANNISNNTNSVIVSRDAIRFSLLKEGEDYFAHEKEVVKIFFQNINNALNQGKDVYVDATHLNWKSRKKLIDAIKVSNIKVNAIYFDIPLEVCFKQNNFRSGRACVPNSVIEKMFMDLTDPAADPYHYNSIKYINSNKE